jgi:hypothetical protein
MEMSGQLEGSYSLPGPPRGGGGGGAPGRISKSGHAPEWRSGGSGDHEITEDREGTEFAEARPAEIKNQELMLRRPVFARWAFPCKSRHGRT